MCGGSPCLEDIVRHIKDSVAVEERRHTKYKAEAFQSYTDEQGHMVSNSAFRFFWLVPSTHCLLDKGAANGVCNFIGRPSCLSPCRTSYPLQAVSSGFFRNVKLGFPAEIMLELRIQQSWTVEVAYGPGGSFVFGGKRYVRRCSGKRFV